MLPREGNIVATLRDVHEIGQLLGGGPLHLLVSCQLICVVVMPIGEPNLEN